MMSSDCEAARLRNLQIKKDFAAVGVLSGIRVAREREVFCRKGDPLSELLSAN